MSCGEYHRLLVVSALGVSCGFLFVGVTEIIDTVSMLP